MHLWRQVTAKATILFGGQEETRQASSFSSPFSSWTSVIESFLSVLVEQVQKHPEIRDRTTSRFILICSVL